MRIKKLFICLLLALIMIFTSACGKGNSGDISAESDAVSEISRPAENKTPYTEKMDALYASGVDKTGTRSNVAYGKDYETSADYSEQYPDVGQSFLTDGFVPQGFEAEGVWAGYYITDRTPMVIDIDLDGNYTNILELHAYMLQYDSYGIGAPTYVKYYISDDGKNYEYLTTAYRDQRVNDNSVCDYAVYLQGGISFNYLRIETSDILRVWLFIGEISVIAYGDEYDSVSEGYVSGDNYYGFKGVPCADIEEYWEDPSDETVNLSKGITGTVSCGSRLSDDIANSWYNSKSISELTDGKKAAAASYSDIAFVHFTRGDSRSIYFDLGKLSGITGFNAELLRDSGAAVNFPRFFKVALSADGKKWQTVISKENISALDENAIQNVGADFERCYKARFVRVSFVVDIHTYISEIEIFGKKSTEGACDIVGDSENGGEDSADGNYIMPEDFCDVHNIILSYNCLPDDSGNSTEDGLATKEEYLPYVGYYDAEGNLVDTMFDGFLYLPYTRFNYSSGAKKLSGWKTYLNDIYYPERNMDALEAAAEEVYGQLGIDSKLKVFTSVLYTFPNIDGEINVFGDIDGDGKNETFSEFEDRKKAIKWIMDEELSRFNKGNYSYLEFCGFYWFEEQITYSDPHEVELIRFASDYAHELGFKLMWIPYQQASGYMDWEDLGFDLGCIQPNYMFRDNSTADVLYTTAEQAKTLGMCVEMEMNSVSSSKDIGRFNEYMIAGAETGYMNAVKIYYQNGLPGAFYQASVSSDPSVRKLYDNVYLYAKEKYNVVSLVGTVISEEGFTFNCKKNENQKFVLDISDMLELGEITITLSPKYGAIMRSSDGVFYYFPPEDYTGTDTFQFCISDGHTSTEPVTVTMYIG